MRTSGGKYNENASEAPPQLFDPARPTTITAYYNDTVVVLSILLGTRCIVLARNCSSVKGPRVLNIAPEISAAVSTEIHH